MKHIRKRLTYANVMSSIAVFLVLGGGAAIAAKNVLPKNSVGAKQIKKNAVTTAKIKKNAVTAAKIKKNAVTTAKIKQAAINASRLADGGVTADKLADSAVAANKLAESAVTNPKLANDVVTGAKVADGSLTGADIDQGSLTSVKAANVYAALFESTGSTIAHASDPGIKSGGCFLACIVEFPRDISECVPSATSAENGTSVSGVPAMAEAVYSSDKNSVVVAMFDDEGTLINHDFALTVTCPTT